MRSADAPEQYRHTQIGWTILIATGLPMVLCLVLTPMFPERFHLAWVLLTVGMLVGVMLLFATLKVIVYADRIHVRFGVGFIRRTYALSEFLDVNIVRNRWFYGWGIRLGFKGVMYNVSGLNAVELKRVDGGVMRIGTDQPKALKSALRAALDGYYRDYMWHSPREGSG